MIPGRGRFAFHIPPESVFTSLRNPYSQFPGTLIHMPRNTHSARCQTCRTTSRFTNEIRRAAFDEEPLWPWIAVQQAGFRHAGSYQTLSALRSSECRLPNAPPVVPSVAGRFLQTQSTASTRQPAEQSHLSGLVSIEPK